MKKTVVITQPTYLPWLGYFELMRQADVFIFLDSVQFERKSWQCRNRIQTADGKLVWLTVPHKSHPLETAIADVEICNEPAAWGLRHLELLRTHLGSAPHVDEMLSIVEPALTHPPARLADLTIPLIQAFAERLGLQAEFRRSSELPVTGRRTELVLNLLHHVGATDYYSPAGSKVYMERDRHQFAEAGIQYRYQDWPHPEYAQPGSRFSSHLAIVDALAWTGRCGVRRMLGAG